MEKNAVPKLEARRKIRLSPKNATAIADLCRSDSNFRRRVAQHLGVSDKTFNWKELQAVYIDPAELPAVARAEAREIEVGS